MRDPDRHLAAILRTSSRAFASHAVEMQLTVQPDALHNFGSEFDLNGDSEVRLMYLAASLAADRVDLFLDHISWLKVAMTSRDLDLKYLDENLASLSKALSEDLPEGTSTRPLEFLAAGRKHLQTTPPTIPSFLESGGELLDLARQYMLAVLETRTTDAVKLVVDAFHAGADASALCSEVVHTAQMELGRMWQMNEIHIAEEHLGSRIAERALSALNEVVTPNERNGRRVLCAAPGGEMHEMGLRVVSNHFDWAGWESILLGSNMPTLDLVRAILDFEIDLVALSATTALQAEPVFDAIRTIRQHATAPILVGGLPFLRVPDLGEVVGADAVAFDGQDAVEVANSLVAV